MKEIEIKDFNCNPFDLIGKEWMLITAENKGVVNTMTASWGGLGVLWNHNVVYIFVRKSRYTKEFIDNADNFSLTFFDIEKYRKDLGYLGRVSGRDENKIEKVGFHVEHKEGVPYFEEANKVIICKKLSMHHISPEGMIDPEILPKWYADEDYHDLYIGEIQNILIQE